MARITNLQNEIAKLQQVLHERNETIAGKNREISKAQLDNQVLSSEVLKLRAEATK